MRHIPSETHLNVTAVESIIFFLIHLTGDGPVWLRRRLQFSLGRSGKNPVPDSGRYLACSKSSDSGERCEVKKAMKSRGGLGREVREPSSLSHLSPSLAFIFSLSFLLRTAPHYLNAWNRLVGTGQRVMEAFSCCFFFLLLRKVLFKKVEVISPFGTEGCRPSLVVFNH